MDVTQSLEEILIKQRQSIILGDIKELNELTGRARIIVSKLRESGGLKSREEALRLKKELSQNVDLLEFAMSINTGLLNTLKKEQKLRKTGTILKKI